MSKKKGSIRIRLGRLKIGKQLAIMYVAAVFLPITLLGVFLLTKTSTNQKAYYTDLLQSYSRGVSQTLNEITSQIYTISDSIVYNDSLIEFLNGEYETEQEMIVAASKTVLLDKYVEKYAGVEEIQVYVDRADMIDYGEFHKVTDEVRESDWYRKACDRYIPFWLALESQSFMRKNMNWNLALVRKMVLVGGEREAVILIKVRSSYLGSRIENSRYTTLIAIDDQTFAFSNSREYYGTYPQIDIDYGDSKYTYTGESRLDGQAVLVDVSTQKLSKTANFMYLICYDQDGLMNIGKDIKTTWHVLIGAILLPLAFVITFSGSFAGQVKRLRAEMGKASRGEYDEMSEELLGSEELSDAFEDLLVMVKNIQRMEAEQYESQLRAQDIRNEQQKMEYKMLANQINPHFLYNTLEMIRMKALTADDREVANAIKLLGRSMRYVLDNSGMSDTTLQKEYDHILIYLQIQRLRFGDRVNYETEVQQGIELDEYKVMPLILQPIVENAIIHGLEGRESDGHLTINIGRYGDDLRIDVSDNGDGMSKEKLAEIRGSLDDYRSELPTSNIGLYNIHRRIKLSYGDRYGLKIESVEGMGTCVSLLLPIIM